MTRLPAYIAILLILAGGIAACKDDPVTPGPGGKDSCDTCLCDTCKVDTIDTVIVTSNDTTSHDFTWTEYNLSGESSINGCWVFSDTEIWVCGNDLYRFSAEQWQRITNIGSGTKIFGFTPSDSWLWSTGIIWHYKDGKKIEYRIFQDGLSILHYPEDGELRAAWGTSSNDMFFVGDKGTIVHLDGTNWMKFPKVTERHIRSVWGTASNDVWACGWDDVTALSVLLHYDGTTWSVIDLNTLGNIGAGAHALLTVWSCDSAGHKVVVGAGSMVWRKTDDGGWRHDSAGLRHELGGGGVAPIGVWGNGPNDLMAAGSYGYISHWSGASWKKYEQFWQPGNPFAYAACLSMKGNTAVVAGSKNGSWIAVGRRGK